MPMMGASHFSRQASQMTGCSRADSQDNLIEGSSGFGRSRPSQSAIEVGPETGMLPRDDFRLKQ